MIKKPKFPSGSLVEVGNYNYCNKCNSSLKIKRGLLYWLTFGAWQTVIGGCINPECSSHI